MIRQRKLISFLPLLLACLITVGQNDHMTIPSYIDHYSELAQAEMRRTGIPASITLAQGILESSFGNSKLAKKARNHFGIKCGGNWDGQTFFQDDDEKAECFRKYKSVLHSYVDHSNFLIGKDRYASLFALAPNDYKGWAKGLQKAGYATNPNYSTLLIKLIEERNLYRYDTEKKYQVLSDEEKEYLRSFNDKFFMFNGVKTVISQPNEMALDLAYKYDISLNQLLNYNDLKETDVIPPGSRIYLQPKKRKGYDVYHRVEEGETMYSISQKQAIKLRSLYKKNLMEWGEEPAFGETLCLRKKCTTSPRLKSDEDIKRDIQKEIAERLEKVGTPEPVKKPTPEPVYKKPETTQRYEKPEPTNYDPKEFEESEPLDVIPTPEVEEPVREAYKEPEVVEPVETEPEIEYITKEIPRYHTVQPKETLYRISVNYNVPVIQLKSWNKLASNALSIGQKLIVGYETTQVEQRVTKPKDIEPQTTTFNSANVDPAEIPVTYHKVKVEETLFSISKKYGIPVDVLKRLNRLTSNEIQIGQVLKLKE